MMLAPRRNWASAEQSAQKRGNRGVLLIQNVWSTGSTQSVFPEDMDTVFFERGWTPKSTTHDMWRRKLRCSEGLGLQELKS